MCNLRNFIYPPKTLFLSFFSSLLIYLFSSASLKEACSTISCALSKFLTISWSLLLQIEKTDLRSQLENLILSLPDFIISNNMYLVHISQILKLIDSIESFLNIFRVKQLEYLFCSYILSRDYSENSVINT